jgi:hypothetical protein
MANGFIFLAAVMDWHRSKVPAWQVSISMDTAFCVQAGEEAMARHGRPDIFSRDQRCPELVKGGASSLARLSTGCSRDMGPPSARLRQLLDFMAGADGRTTCSSSGCGRASSARLRQLLQPGLYLKAYETGSEARRSIG